MTSSHYNELITLAEAIIAASANENTAARVGGLLRQIIVAIQDNQAVTDLEPTARSAADATLQANIDAEAAARSAADSALQTAVNSESSARTSADSILQANIDAEATARADEDNALLQRIDEERDAREAADTAHDGRIGVLETARQSQSQEIATLQTGLTTLQTDLTTEARERGIADTEIRNLLIEERTTRGQADTALQEAIATEEQARRQEGSRLEGNIEAAEEDMIQRIAAEANARASAVSAEASARTSADSTLQTNINTEAAARALLATRVLYMEQCFGKYDNKREITLAQAKAGKYVNTSGVETSATGYGISNAVSVLAGDMLLIPSASAVPAAVSVVSRVVTRTYDKVINYTYTTDPETGHYLTATADYDSSLVYTAVYDEDTLTGWTRAGVSYSVLPATRNVTDSFYEPLVKQSASAMPSTGYYIYLCPTAMEVVISGYTATVNGGKALIVGWGIFKNICTNFVGAPGQSVLAQAFAQQQAEIDGLKAQLAHLGETKATSIDFEESPKLLGQPMFALTDGAPAEVPHAVGLQRFDPATGTLYISKAVTNSTSDWDIVN